MQNLFAIPIRFCSRVEQEIWRRIKVAIWAYAYEVMADSIVDDHSFDRECQLVDLTIATGNEKMDNWFRKNFQPHTGQWIHKHPELDGIKRKYEQHYRTRAK